MGRDPSKTEEATPKRIRKAREKGNVPKSQEASKTITVLAGLFGVFFWISYMANEFEVLFQYFFSQAVYFNPTEENIIGLFVWMMAELAKMILPVVIIIGVCVLILLRIQVGKLWTTKVFEFKLSKFNPISGIKRMFFSAQTFIRLGKSLLLSLCIGFAPWIVIRREMDHFLDLYYADPSGVAVYILSIAFRITLYALVPMVMIAIVDIWYSRWSYRQDLKMSKDEVKDEQRQSEGDPAVKQSMRKKMMQLSARRMMQEVPKADVVITNPTHIAIALRYDSSEAPAPIVVAKGANKVAEKIKEIAKENKVPLRENKPLARALYKQTQVGDLIPASLFQAVAAILAQIWKTKQKK